MWALLRVVPESGERSKGWCLRFGVRDGIWVLGKVRVRLGGWKIGKNGFRLREREGAGV